MRVELAQTDRLQAYPQHVPLFPNKIRLILLPLSSSFIRGVSRILGILLAVNPPLTMEEDQGANVMRTSTKLDKTREKVAELASARHDGHVCGVGWVDL